MTEMIGAFGLTCTVRQFPAASGSPLLNPPRNEQIVTGVTVSPKVPSTGTTTGNRETATVWIAAKDFEARAAASGLALPIEITPGAKITLQEDGDEWTADPVTSQGAGPFVAYYELGLSR